MNETEGNRAMGYCPAMTLLLFDTDILVGKLRVCSALGMGRNPHWLEERNAVLIAVSSKRGTVIAPNIRVSFVLKRSNFFSAMTPERRRS